MDRIRNDSGAVSYMIDLGRVDVREREMSYCDTVHAWQDIHSFVLHEMSFITSTQG